MAPPAYYVINAACMHACKRHSQVVDPRKWRLDRCCMHEVRLVDDDADPDPDPDPAAAVTRERAFLHMIMKQLQL